MNKRRKVEIDKEAEEVKKRHAILQKNEWTDLCTECFHAILSHRNDLFKLLDLKEENEDEWVSETTWMELWNSETQRLWKTLSQQADEKIFIYIQFMSHLIAKEVTPTQAQLKQRMPLTLVHKLLTYIGKQTTTKAKRCKTWSEIIEAETLKKNDDADDGDDLEKQEKKELHAMFGPLAQETEKDDQPLKCPERECGWTLEKFGLQIRSADEGYTYFWVCKNPRCVSVGNVVHRVG